MIRINCDLCGKTDESLVRALIEDVELNVCSGCSRFGKVLGPVKTPELQRKTKESRAFEEKEEKIEMLVENYAEIVKKKREAMGLSQKDFANRINEKESTIHKIETGAFEPQLNLAKKLEKVLGVKLIEEYEEKREALERKGGERFTLGDFINVKK